MFQFKFIFCLLLPLVVASACTKNSRLKSSVVVQVNESRLSAEEFASQMASALQGVNALAARDEAMLSQTKARIIQDFVHSVIVAEWAKKTGVFVRKEDLDNEIRKTRSQYPDDASFRSALAEANLSYDEWVARIQKTLLEQLVTLKLRSNIALPTKSEVEQHYRRNIAEFKTDAEVQISQIVLRDEESAERILKELKAGGSFTALAKKFSITPEGETGGDLGWIPRGTNELFDSVARLGIGQLSRITKSPFGYHILKATARRPARTRPLQEVEDQIERDIMAKREQQAYSSWLERQLLSAKVYKNEPLIRSINIVTKLEN